LKLKRRLAPPDNDSCIRTNRARSGVRQQHPLSSLQGHEFYGKNSLMYRKRGLFGRPDRLAPGSARWRGEHRDEPLESRD
jgi:hypothetical protein